VGDMQIDRDMTDIPLEGDNIPAESTIPLEGDNIPAESTIPLEGDNIPAESTIPLEGDNIPAESTIPLEGDNIPAESTIPLEVVSRLMMSLRHHLREAVTLFAAILQWVPQPVHTANSPSLPPDRLTGQTVEHHVDTSRQADQPTILPVVRDSNSDMPIPRPLVHIERQNEVGHHYPESEYHDHIPERSEDGEVTRLEPRVGRPHELDPPIRVIVSPRDTSSRIDFSPLSPFPPFCRELANVDLLVYIDGTVYPGRILRYGRYDPTRITIQDIINCLREERYPVFAREDDDLDDRTIQEQVTTATVGLGVSSARSDINKARSQFRLDPLQRFEQNGALYFPEQPSFGYSELGALIWTTSTPCDKWMTMPSDIRRHALAAGMRLVTGGEKDFQSSVCCCLTKSASESTPSEVQEAARLAERLVDFAIETNDLDLLEQCLPSLSGFMRSTMLSPDTVVKIGTTIRKIVRYARRTRPSLSDRYYQLIEACVDPLEDAISASTDLSILRTATAGLKEAGKGIIDALALLHSIEVLPPEDTQRSFRENQRLQHIVDTLNERGQHFSNGTTYAEIMRRVACILIKYREERAGANDRFGLSSQSKQVTRSLAGSVERDSGVKVCRTYGHVLRIRLIALACITSVAIIYVAHVYSKDRRSNGARLARVGWKRHPPRL